MTLSRQQADDLITACMNPIQWEHHTGSEWQFYVGLHTRLVWNTLSFNQKMAIAIDAHEVLMQQLTSA